MLDRRRALPLRLQGGDRAEFRALNSSTPTASTPLSRALGLAARASDSHACSAASAWTRADVSISSLFSPFPPFAFPLPASSLFPTFEREA